MSRIHWVARGTREVAALVRVLPTFDLRCEENTEPRKWKSPLFDSNNRHKGDIVRGIVIIVSAVFSNLVSGSLIK
jgi:hypothetical protein